VRRDLTMGNLSFRYVQLVDPRDNDRPVVKGYGDYLFGCLFPPAGWNWDLEYFLEVTVSRPNEPPFSATRATLQQGMYVLETGSRAVADMVWRFPGPDPSGLLTVRIVKPAAEANWFYLEAGVEGDPQAQITQVRTGSYPFTTTGPPERQRWATTLTNAYLLTDAAAKFDPATEWGLVLHNRNAQEDGGCLLVLDPQEVASANVGGTYCVGVAMAPPPGTRSVHLAMGYFWDERYDRAVGDFRRDAPAVLQRLRRTDWNARLNDALWEGERKEIDGIVSRGEAPADLVTQWKTFVAETDAALAEARQKAAAGQPVPRETERRFALAVEQARRLKERFYEAAVQFLLKDAVR